MTIAKNSSVKILTQGAINDEMLKNVKRHVNHFCSQQWLKQLSLNSSSSGFSNISESRCFAQVVALDYQTIAKNSSVKILTQGAINEEMLKNVKRHVNHFCRQQLLNQLSLNSSSSKFRNISESRYFAQVVALDYQIIVKNSSGRLMAKNNNWIGRYHTCYW